MSKKCQKETIHIVRHVVQNPKCQKHFNAAQFKEQYKIYKAKKAKEDHNKHQAASIAKLRAEDNEKVKKDQRTPIRKYGKIERK